MQGIISSEAELAAVVDAVEHETEIAVDLEMDSLHHYREKVCLIQISTRKQSWLIDPLAIADLSCLAIPFSNPDLLVVMHGADYDIRSLHRDFGIEVCNLFDTMVASRLLGINEFGLAALLKARFGIELDKKYQKADWSRRPLSPEMCAYAIADTATLLPLYDQLASELQQAGRRLWLDEECRLISQARVTEKNGPLFLGFKGAGKFKITSEDEAAAVKADIAGKEFIVTKVETKEKNISPQPSFITSRLQQEASRVLRLSPKRTMMLA